jgi:hypothetical protein
VPRRARGIPSPLNFQALRKLRLNALIVTPSFIYPDILLHLSRHPPGDTQTPRLPVPSEKFPLLQNCAYTLYNRGMGLSRQKRLFVEAYDGEEIYAMRVAGYTGANSYLKQKATELLRDPDVIEAIKNRDKFKMTTDKAIADRLERQALWTAIMRNNDPYHKEQVDSNGIPLPEENIPLTTRLKASELLGKSEADFVEKVEVNGNLTITDVIKRSYLEDDADDLDAIEAQYTMLQNKTALMPTATQAEETTNIDDFV